MRPSRDIIVGISILVVLSVAVVWLLIAQVTTSTSQQSSVRQQKQSTSTLVSKTAPIPATQKTYSIAKKTKSVTVNVNSSRTPVGGNNVNPLPIDSRDVISSWNLSVIESTTTKKRLQSKIKTLTATIGTGRYSNYNLYTQIAQDYELLGNGEKAYDFYIRAAKSNLSKGLAFSNIGSLMSRLRAYNTASSAYARAVAVEPKIEFYWLGYLNFLTSHDAHSSTTASIFSRARRVTNNAPDVLIATANWEESIGEIKAAIADWKLVLPRVGKEQHKAIDIKIASLQKKVI